MMADARRVLITGANGQLGFELQRTAPDIFAVHAVDAATLDITDAAAVTTMLARLRPDVLINAAAYTAVDRAETEPERAFAVNSEGARYLAEAAKATGCRMLHVSTDFVFDGQNSRPYHPADKPAPLGVYGASKLEGERQVQQVLGTQALILRTAWVYSAHGHNFVKTMLRLMAERDHLAVVADQVGTPTWARNIAAVLWQAAATEDFNGIRHYTDAGVASWYDFAVAIQEEALAIGLLQRAIPLRPIRTEDYPTPARRPAYSVLDKTGTWERLALQPQHWRDGLRGMLRDMHSSMPLRSIGPTGPV